MEDRERPFETVRVSMASAETGQARFLEDIHSRLPLRAFWRLNLTALSQKYNLYFIASAHEVHIYEPQFPFQSLGGKPKLVLTPQLANAGASGYINPNYPHCINHLIVGTLGDQEILLLATDSGNVTAYETRAILNTIEEQSSQISEPPTVQQYADIRPFFAQWVVESAWGLSIHSEGRMIAVSSNTPTSPRHAIGIDDGRASITVFAFALMLEKDDEEEYNSDMDMEMGDYEPEWYIWDPTLLAENRTVPGRDKNYKITLNGTAGHTMNIPCITFINSKEDRTGSWLLSTDIHEDVKLWQIWTAKCKKTWRFKESSISGAAWLGGRELGWCVAALDKQSFQPVSDMESLIGYKRAPQFYGHTTRGASFDITNIMRHHVPTNSLSHPSNHNEDDEDEQVSEEESIRIFEDLSDSESTADEADLARIERIQLELQASLSPPDTATETSSPNVPVDTLTDFEDRLDLQFASDESSNAEPDFELDSNFSDDLTSDLDTHSDYVASEPSAVSASSSNPVMSPSRTHHDEPGRNLASSASAESITTTAFSKPRFVRGVYDRQQPIRAKRRTLEIIPDVPFIYCSSSHLRLLGSTHATSPHLFCARMLGQSLDPNLEDGWIVPMDRMDMVEQIPELGIIIVATQAGRCAVCSLTRRNSDGIVGLRVDWVLPTQKQERAGTRPPTALLGIAVSPIQGRQDRVSTRPRPSSAEYLTRNRVMNNIPTIFDRETVDLSEIDDSKQTMVETSPSFSPAQHLDAFQSDSELNLYPATLQLATKPHNWSAARSPEPWSTTDGCRRYRFMMTYADMTVLTYELYRGVERSEIRSDESV